MVFYYKGFVLSLKKSKVDFSEMKNKRQNLRNFGWNKSSRDVITHDQNYMVDMVMMNWHPTAIITMMGRFIVL